MTSGLLDRFAAASAVADAVLYEGYVLYPYRASAQKNQLRWQFGVLTPPSYSVGDDSERSWVRTECVLRPQVGAVLHVRVRCLQLQHRSVEVAVRGQAGEATFVPTGRLEVDDSIYMDWDEAVEHVVDVAPVALEAPADSGYVEQFLLAGGEDEELLGSADGEIAGRVVRSRRPLAGSVRVAAGPVTDGDPFQLVRIVVENTTTAPGQLGSRDEALAYSLVAVHTMLAVDDGAFVSLLDPPVAAGPLVAQCHNEGTFPVLIGSGDAVLSSPIILYDHPAIAPESPGDLYDATEIDEILALRVLTLTDEEKAEARQTDPRSAAIVDRCDAMAPEAWGRLHGEMRTLRPRQSLHGPPGGPDEPETVPTWGTDPGGAAAWWDPAADAAVDPWCDSVTIDGVVVSKGSAVRLCPSHRADAQDLFVHGRRATVAGVFSDVDGGTHLAVSIDDDPANEELAWQGRYLFFHPDEVEPVGARSDGPSPDGAPARAARVLIAGIGNMLLGDDGFGVEVAARLAGSTLPAGVRAADFGIKGVHLAYELLDGYDALVLIDAIDLGEPPGTLAVVEPDRTQIEGDGNAGLDAHSMSPDVVLATLARIGGRVDRVYVVGCQPADLGEGIGLSGAVAAVVDAAAALCRELADEIIGTVSRGSASRGEAPR